MNKCSICRKGYDGHGHNAEPINSGYCCDKCNKEVLKARMLEVKELTEDTIGIAMTLKDVMIENQVMKSLIKVLTDSQPKLKEPIDKFIKLTTEEIINENKKGEENE